MKCFISSGFWVIVCLGERDFIATFIELRMGYSILSRVKVSMLVGSQGI